MPKTFLLRHHGTDTKLIEGRTLVIGRDPDCDLRIGDDPGVSRRHAALRVDAEGVWLEDLGSQNGVFLNGVRIERATCLKDVDWFRVGQHEFSVRVAWGKTAIPDETRTQSIRIIRPEFREEKTPVDAPLASSRASTPSTSVLDIQEVNAFVSIQQSCRAALADSGLPCLDRINAAFHLIQAIADMGSEADATVLLGEMLDMFRNHDLGGVLPPLSAARIHALVSRLWKHVGTDPTWQERLEALRKAGASR